MAITCVGAARIGVAVARSRAGGAAPFALTRAASRASRVHVVPGCSQCTSFGRGPGRPGSLGRPSSRRRVSTQGRYRVLCPARASAPLLAFRLFEAVRPWPRETKRGDVLAMGGEQGAASGLDGPIGRRGRAARPCNAGLTSPALPALAPRGRRPARGPVSFPAAPLPLTRPHAARLGPGRPRAHPASHRPMPGALGPNPVVAAAARVAHQRAPDGSHALELTAQGVFWVPSACCSSQGASRGVVARQEAFGEHSPQEVLSAFALYMESWHPCPRGVGAGAGTRPAN